VPTWQGRKSFALPVFDPLWERVQPLAIAVGMHSGDPGYHRYIDEWEGLRDAEMTIARYARRASPAFLALSSEKESGNTPPSGLIPDRTARPSGGYNEAREAILTKTDSSLVARAQEEEALPKAQVAELTPVTSVSRSRKGEQTRARLVKAAKEVFERDGFLNSRISDISKRANISYGAFYHYFDSKEQIFREVAQAQEARLTLPADEDGHARPGGDSPLERIREGNRRYLERYRSEARIMGVIEQVSRYDPYVNAARMERVKHFAERAERAIRQLQKQGKADTRVNPTIAADALGSMVARLAEQWLTQGYGDYEFDEVVDQLTLLWANALGLNTDEIPKRGRRRTAK
jgi:AcrR family transcriptional regulator